MRRLLALLMLPLLAAAPPTGGSGRDVANAFAGRLASDFVFPDVGRRYADRLHARAVAGDYDGLPPADLARRLTEDVQAVAADGHLHVDPPGAGMRPAPVAGMAPSRPPSRAVQEARWLGEGIGYIRFRELSGDPDSLAATRRFMADHAGARALIIDLRVCRGGGQSEMDVIFPYLFARETALLDMDTRAAVEAAEGPVFDEGPTLRRAAGPAGVVRRVHYALPTEGERRLRAVPVLILTSPRTASAGEHFSLAMKRTGRGTLIGGTTAGAGHYGGVVELAGGYTAFVPFGRTFDPDTGRGWEATGVTPDVAVAPERALVEALVRLKLPPAEAERLSAEVAPTDSMAPRRPAGWTPAA